MSIVAIAPSPFPPTPPGATWARTAVSLSPVISGASTTRCAIVFRAPKDGNIESFGLAYSQRTGTEDIKFSFQDVDVSNGTPDGTIDQFVVLSSASVPTVSWPSVVWLETSPTSDGTGGGSKRAVSAGDVIAFVIEWDSTQSGDFQCTYLYDGGLGSAGAATYGLQYAGSWAKTGLTNAFYCIGVKYDDGVWYPLADWIFPIDGISFTDFNSSSTPDEYSNVFTLAAPIRVNGAWVATIPTGDFKLVLYNSGGTAIGNTPTIDKDQINNASTISLNSYPFVEGSIELAAGTYRIALLPTTTTNVRAQIHSFDSSAVRQGSFGLGNLSTRADLGSWTDDATQRLMIGLILDGIDSGGSSGGGDVSYV